MVVLTMPGCNAKPLQGVTEPAYPTAGGYRLEITLPKGLNETVQNQLSSLATVPGVTIVAHTR